MTNVNVEKVQKSFGVSQLESYSAYQNTSGPDQVAALISVDFHFLSLLTLAFLPLYKFSWQLLSCQQNKGVISCN
jgi:hypothetical protein